MCVCVCIYIYNLQARSFEVSFKIPVRNIFGVLKNTNKETIRNPFSFAVMRRADRGVRKFIHRR